ncbi:hypothetical protein [Pelosinus sp. UFO1]|uniref:hypothetical protein n=1 Tax=Pelosinus sp. UFO1 TaxID=484770 RepID=UPI0004D130BB|nr:hypothetical protein [Pelosinus sp. UFO1]AIF52928.1 hypothetical protein UFO1_3385 [Pelosinus sp. UFO1]
MGVDIKSSQTSTNNSSPQVWSFVSQEIKGTFLLSRSLHLISRVKGPVPLTVELYFVLVEKMTVFDGGRLIVSLLDGTEIECEMK